MYGEIWKLRQAWVILLCELNSSASRRRKTRISHNSFLSSLVAKQIKLHNFVDFNMINPILSSYVWAIRCLQAHNSHPPKHTQNPIWFWILYTSYGLVKVHPMLGLPFQPWAVGSTSYTWASPSTTIALVYEPKIWKDNKGKRFLANFKQCGPMWAT